MESVRALPLISMGATATAAGLVGLLHVVPPSDAISPVRRTISHYALLETGWVFTAAVLILSAGSLAALAALLRARLLPVASTATGALLLWSASLGAIAYFPKHDWSAGPTISGDLHRVASVAAFLSLPAAALLLGRAWLRDPRWRWWAYACGFFGVLSLLFFSPIVVAVAMQPVTGVEWWVAIPLGAVERLLALSQVATVLCLARWAAAATPRAAATPPSDSAFPASVAGRPAG